MDNRTLKVTIGKAGGNASKQSKKHLITIPNKWAQEMGITAGDRELEATFKNGKITLEKIKKSLIQERSLENE